MAIEIIYKTSDNQQFTRKEEAEKHEAEIEAAEPTKQYGVTVPFHGYYFYLIDAKSKEEAIQKAQQKYVHDYSLPDIWVDDNEIEAEEN